MSPQSKKMSHFTVVILAVAAAVFSVMALSCSRSDAPREEKRTASSRSAPLMDLTIKEVLPVEKLNVDRKDPQALALLADQYFDSRDYAQAAEIYKQVIQLNPTDTDSYNDLGLAYHYTNRSALALDVLKKGTTVDPSFQRIWLSYGFVLLSTGQAADARIALNRVIELNSENDVGQEAQRMLGRIQ